MKPALRAPRIAAGGESGFSILEVMQTLALLAIGLLGLSSLTVGTIHGNSTAKQITSAAVLAQDKAEELRHADYAAIADGADEQLVSGVSYSRQWSVCANCPVPGTKQVTIEVGWLGQQDRTVRLQTVIAD